MHPNNPSTSPDMQNDARVYFPRGLIQPEGSFRFSIDALLLGSFATPAPGARVIDLGTGCGVVAFAMLLKDNSLEITGLDLAPCLINSAIKNAQKLGFEQHFSPMLLDVSDVRKNLIPESFDLAVCNPPYRKAKQGQIPKGTMRINALVEHRSMLENFISAAAFCLKNTKNFCCIYPAERLPELFITLARYRLEPKQLLPIQTLENKDCRLILVRATKNGNPGLILEKPLILYKEIKNTEDADRSEGKKNKLTEEALTFCPWLLCNT